MEPVLKSRKLLPANRPSAQSPERKEHPGTTTLMVGWKVATLDPGIASVRYRAVFPMLALEARGVTHRLFDDCTARRLRGLDALVIVKSFTAADVLLAQDAAARGIPVIFDLCDNIFLEAYRGKNIQTPAAMLRAMAPHLSLIVVTTEPLAAIVREALGNSVRVRVVPDSVETPSLVAAAEQCLRAARGGMIRRSLRRFSRLTALVARKLHLLRSVRTRTLAVRVLMRFSHYLHWRFWAKMLYRRYDDVRRWWRTKRILSSSVVADPLAEPRADPSVQPERCMLWFGNHGAEHARFGMLDLLEVREALETVAAEFNAELLVVSNNREKYQQHIKPLALPTRYLEWTPDVQERALAGADVVVIPNTRDAFSICKSANRTVLALSRGKPVVATPTPALEPLLGCIEHEDFACGLCRYLENGEYAAQHIAAGRRLIDEYFGAPVIAKAWLDAIDEAQAMRPCPAVGEPELLLALHQVQDLDLAVPLIVAAQRRGHAVEVWLTVTLCDKSPRVMASLRALDIPLRVLPDADRATELPRSTRALLAVVESNLNPHRFARRLTEAANAAGLMTATLQHGFENIGLTYDDDIHAIEQIDFASRRIYLWGPLSTLHPAVRAATRNKCVPVGCTKPAEVPTATLDHLLTPGRKVVGVFENLHWHRYDDAYRAFFIAGVQALADAYPELIFLVKPHHAGRWLTARFSGGAPAATNLIIADPAAPAWENHTAPALLGRLAAVITTPSTVALDAARRALPTAVVAHTLALANYAPLPLITTDADWSGFINEVFDTDARTVLERRAQEYVGRVLIPGDACIRILDDLLPCRTSQPRSEILT